MFSGVKGQGQGNKAEENRLLGLAADLHSKVETEKAEPRRKLPGGQSSPQSLRGIASIVVPMGERWESWFGGLGITVNGYICRLLDMAPSLAIGAEAMDTPICGRLFHTFEADSQAMYSLHWISNETQYAGYIDKFVIQ